MKTDNILLASISSLRKNPSNCCELPKGKLKFN